MRFLVVVYSAFLYTISKLKIYLLVFTLAVWLFYYTSSDSTNSVMEEKASPPWGFSWIVENELAGMAYPRTMENLNYIWQQGIRHLVTLSPEKIPPINGTNFEWTLIAVEEFEAPTLEDIIKFIDICEKCISEKKGVGVHCRMGRGRTGVMAACFLVHFHGMTPENAILKLRYERPGSVETYEQERIVWGYYDYFWGTKMKDIPT